jgi:hypothetical protein
LAIGTVEAVGNEKMRAEIRAHPLRRKSRKARPVQECVAAVHIGGRVFEPRGQSAHSLLDIAAVLFVRVDDDLGVAVILIAIDEETAVGRKSPPTRESAEQLIHHCQKNKKEE